MDQRAKDTLLLSCLGIGSDEAIASQVQQLSRPDWDEVIEESARHRIIPLLYQRLRTLSPTATIPANVEQELREIYLHSSWKNAQRYYELSKVLRALQDNNIPVVVLKGAALAELVYQNIALRPMCDVDLLVRCEDIHRIDELLSQLGFRDTTLSVSKRHTQWIRAVYTSGVINIDLHSRIPEIPGLDPWANASPAKIGSTDTLVLGAEDFLLHLCLHLDHHLHKGPPVLIWWCDIVRFLKDYGKELDWDYVIRIAKESRVEAVVHRILHAIDEGFDIHISADILSQLRDDGVAISINDILHSKEAVSRGLGTLFPIISAIPSIRGKLYHILRRFFPCREYMERRYSASRSNYVYFYYLVSMGEVATRALKILYQLPGYLKSKHASRSN